MNIEMQKLVNDFIITNPVVLHFKYYDALYSVVVLCIYFAWANRIERRHETNLEFIRMTGRRIPPSDIADQIRYYRGCKRDDKKDKKLLVRLKGVKWNEGLWSRLELAKSWTDLSEEEKEYIISFDELNKTT